MEPVPEIRADRSLLLPGPLPPLSHLGATLLRHSVHTSLRYALYQLGLPTPEAPPTRFVALRLYFDRPSLSDSLGTAPGSEEILGALLHPGGAAVAPLPRRLRGALWFHRRRLSTKNSAAGRWLSPNRTSPARTQDPRVRLSELLPPLGDALLGDLIAALDRRRLRTGGQHVDPAQSPEAARFLKDARPDLSRLGLPDPIAASWNDSRPPLDPGSSVPVEIDCPADRLRGGFREYYRHLLDLLRPSLLALGDRAVRRGHLASVEDLFFLPLDLLDDLDGELKPDWLDEAIQSNREEWRELRSRKAPADTLGNVEPAARLSLPDLLVPLWPLV
ncbi:MAG: hypothetical protein GY769_02885 [bacterium]|nr:hypothetical protein [bacterium]